MAIDFEVLIRCCSCNAIFYLIFDILFISVSRELFVDGTVPLYVEGTLVF